MKITNLGYLMKEGIRGIFLHGFMSFAAVLVTVACLVIVGGFSALVYNVNIMVEDLNKTNEIMAYVDSDLTDAEARSIGTQINRIDNVLECTFVSREKALADFVADYENPAAFDGTDPETLERVWSGPASHNGIDSSCFIITMLSKFQTSELDRAHYYGCRSYGNWGFRDQQGNKYKSFYALQIIGEIVNGYQSVCRGSEIDPDGPELLKAFPVKSADGKKALLLVDYLGKAWRHKVEGVAKDAKVTAEVLDFRRSRVPVDVKFEDGVLNLRKWGSGSSLFFVKFE